MLAKKYFFEFTINMKVNPINYGIYSIPRRKNTNNSPERYNLELRREVVSFGSKDLLELPDESVLQQIRGSINYKNFVGQGTEAVVYRVKDTDYCVRIPYEFRDADVYKKYSRVLTPADKVNHAVAKLELGTTLMKYFEGTTPKAYYNCEKARYKFQERIAEMPLKSFSDLLHQIAGAIDNEMRYDFSAGNLIVDFNKNKLTAIDFIGIGENPRPVRPLIEMYSVLTSFGAETRTDRKLFEKVFCTGVEEFKAKRIPCMDVELFDFDDICEKRLTRSQQNKDKSFVIDDIKNVVCDLKNIKRKEIIDKSLSPVLEMKILNLKNLVKLIA